MTGPQPLVIDVRGSNVEIGQQHAAATQHLRPAVEEWVGSQLAEHPLVPETARQIDEVETAWRDLTPGTLEQLDGMGEVYGIPPRELLVAVLGTYLRSRARAAASSDGCTTFAVGRPAPILVKNRDNDPRFLSMQTVLRVVPEDGMRWLGLSTAGAPGAHSSGMNEAGLCVADTHVPAADIGPGMPRFSSMMHLLEQCATTDEAIQLLLTTPQMGLGNLTLVDRDGERAVVECGFRKTVVRTDVDAPAVATNHYVSSFLSVSLLEPADGPHGLDSRARYQRVLGALASADGVVAHDTRWAQDLAAWHGAPDDAEGDETSSLCEHGPGVTSETISTAIYDPVGMSLDLCIGRPCSAPFSRIPFDAGRTQ